MIDDDPQMINNKAINHHSPVNSVPFFAFLLCAYLIRCCGVNSVGLLLLPLSQPHAAGLGGSGSFSCPLLNQHLRADSSSASSVSSVRIEEEEIEEEEEEEGKARVVVVMLVVGAAAAADDAAGSDDCPPFPIAVTVVLSSLPSSTSIFSV